MPIPDYPDYLITQDGRVWSNKRNEWLNTSCGVVSLYNGDGEKHNKKIPTLLAITWFPESRLNIATPKQVRILRRQAGYTNPQLASYLGVHVQTVKQWQLNEDNKNHRAIPTDKFLKLKSLYENLFK